MPNFDDYDMDMGMSSEDHAKNEMGNFTPIPEGTYDLVVNEATWKESGKKPGNHYLNLQFKVLGGEHDGRVIFEAINLINASDQCKKAAQATLRQFLDASGWEGTTKPVTSDFPNMIVKAHVVVGDEYNGKRGNDIKEYLAGSTASAPVNAEKVESSNGDSPWS